MDVYLSDLERKVIRDPLEARDFAVEFDEEEEVVIATKGAAKFVTPYLFYREAFGVPVSSNAGKSANK